VASAKTDTNHVPKLFKSKVKKQCIKDEVDFCFSEYQLE
jgi:hypothetical protein